MIAYDEYGNSDNPILLLLHGAGVLDTFSGQYCLAKRFHLIIPHLPGAGKAAGEVYEPKSVVYEIFALIDSLKTPQIGLIGHSLGAQLAIMLVCERPKQFKFAVFLSAWLNPKPSMIKWYCSFAAISAKMMKLNWLIQLQGKYWHLTKSQTDYMVKYLKRITPQVYASFFENTLNLQELPAYWDVNIPMLAVCGNNELKDIKKSLHTLGENSHCKIAVLPKANHDFPMRKYKELNVLLDEFMGEIAEKYDF